MTTKQLEAFAWYHDHIGEKGAQITLKKKLGITRNLDVYRLYHKYHKYVRNTTITSTIAG